MSILSPEPPHTRKSPRPERTCVGCRERAAVDELLRVVAVEVAEGWEVLPDPRRRAPGRGAHLHPTPDCLALALKRRAFARALRIPSGSRASGAGLRTGRLEQEVREWSSTSSTDRIDRQKWSSSS
jgi:predicted RNA-binding protein YlxR (DUF448 family)